MANAFRFLFIFVALSGVALIAYYLFVGDPRTLLLSDDETETVKVTRETRPQPAADTQKAPRDSGNTPPEQGKTDKAALKDLSAQEAAAKFSELPAEMRSDFASRYVAAIGETQSIAVAGRYRDLSNPINDDAFAFSLSQAALELYDNGTAAYYVAYAYNTGRGVNRDLDAALKHYGHPALAASPSIAFQRALILGDERYANSDMRKATQLLRQIVSSPEASAALKERAKSKLADLE